MRWEKFNSEVLAVKFDWSAVDYYMENQDNGIICSLVNEDDDTIWAISLRDTESPYCIEGVYVGQELSEAEEELEKRGYVFSYDDRLDDELKGLYDNKYDYSSTYANDKDKKKMFLYVKEKKIRAAVVMN